MPSIGVGMPALVRLEAYGARIYDAFGHLPYLVGSAAVSKVGRDVDVRLVLPDEEFVLLFPEHRRPDRLDLKWALICDALAGLGQATTGLPIDFQIQRQTQSDLYHGRTRVLLGLRITGGGTT